MLELIILKSIMDEYDWMRVAAAMRNATRRKIKIKIKRDQAHFPISSSYELERANYKSFIGMTFTSIAKANYWQIKIITMYQKPLFKMLKKWYNNNNGDY